MDAWNDMMDRMFHDIVQSQKKPEFEIWRTVKLGTGLKVAADFLRAFQNSGMNAEPWSSLILENPAFSVAPAEIEIKLARISVGKLHLKYEATYKFILGVAKSSGLRLCPPEVGPQLRLQYQDQPVNDSFLIGMEPMRIKPFRGGSHLRAFEIAHDNDGLMLNTAYVEDDVFWPEDNHLVFVHPGY